MKITDKTIDALIVLADHPNITAREFAQYLQDNGATSGKGIWLSAGSYLAKLKSKGLVQVDIPHSIRLFKLSPEGSRILRDYIDEGWKSLENSGLDKLEPL